MEGETFLDPLQFLRALDESEIPCLLIGRQALILLGAPLLTQDYDFLLSPEREHLKDLLRLAKGRGLEASIKKAQESPFFSLLSDNLKLDFFRARGYATVDGERFTFEEVYARKETIAVEDFHVRVPRIEDLIRLKKVRNLPRDQEDLKYLQVLLERRGR